MEIRDIRYIVEIANTGNITKAATQLYVSQPALSKTLKKCEAELGTILFQRDGSLLIPTDECRYLIEAGGSLIREYDNIMKELYNIRDEKEGFIRIGIPTSMVSFDFPRIISKFRIECPNIVVQVEEAGARALEKQVADGNLDLSLSLQPVIPSGLNEIPLVQDEFICVMNRDHPLAENDKITISDLSGYRFNTWSSDHAFYQILAENFRNADKEPRIGIMSSNNEFLLEMSRYENDICLLPRPVVLRHNHEGLVMKSFEPVLDWNLCLAFRKNTIMTNRLYVMMRCIQEAMQDLKNNNWISCI